MTSAISMEELLAWSEESAAFWKAHLEANPALLELPCGIGGTANVQEFARHVWGVDLIWAQRLAGLPVTDRKEFPTGPVEALFGLHVQAMAILRGMLAEPERDWSEKMTLKSPWLPPEGIEVSRRKVLVHVLLHSQRHWAQLATLVRAAGFPSGFKGDFLMSRVME